MGRWDKALVITGGGKFCQEFCRISGETTFGEEKMRRLKQFQMDRLIIAQRTAM